jgi:molybdopterin-guanine dinucleotide biosynthesis protein A
MGSDKGLLKLEAKTWAQTAIDKIAVLNIPIRISVNTEQHDAYTKVFSPAELIADNTSLAVHGPLLGTLSSHLRFPEEDLFLLACDLPLMESFLLERLHASYRENPGSDVYLFTNENQPEPLCGIYTAKGLAMILDMLRQNQLPKHSMKFMLDHLTVNSRPLGDEEKKYFRNFNAHAELNGL